MNHAYKLLFIFRPLVWALVAMMIAAFGRAFLKKLLNVISIFLFVISIGGAIVVSRYVKKIADPYGFATTDDVTMCIVGSVTIICFLVFAIAYLFLGQNATKEKEEMSKFAKFISPILGFATLMIFPFAIMGYCLPFFFLNSIPGIIVGILGECGGLALGIHMAIRYWKKDDKAGEDHET